MENSKRGNVPELQVIASPALMEQFRALKEEKEVLKKEQSTQERTRDKD